MNDFSTKLYDKPRKMLKHRKKDNDGWVILGVIAFIATIVGIILALTWPRSEKPVTYYPYNDEEE